MDAAAIVGHRFRVRRTGGTRPRAAIVRGSTGRRVTTVYILRINTDTGHPKIQARITAILPNYDPDNMNRFVRSDVDETTGAKHILVFPPTEEDPEGGIGFLVRASDTTLALDTERFARESDAESIVKVQLDEDKEVLYVRKSFGSTIYKVSVWDDVSALVGKSQHTAPVMELSNLRVSLSESGGKIYINMSISGIPREADPSLESNWTSFLDKPFVPMPPSNDNSPFILCNSKSLTTRGKTEIVDDDWIKSRVQMCRGSKCLLGIYDQTQIIASPGGQVTKLDDIRDESGTPSKKVCFVSYVGFLYQASINEDGDVVFFPIEDEEEGTASAFHIKIDVSFRTARRVGITTNTGFFILASHMREMNFALQVSSNFGRPPRDSERTDPIKDSETGRYVIPTVFYPNVVDMTSIYAYIDENGIKVTMGYVESTIKGAFGDDDTPPVFSRAIALEPREQRISETRAGIMNFRMLHENEMLMYTYREDDAESASEKLSARGVSHLITPQTSVVFAISHE
jgi:hypothetical protein